MGEIKQFVLCRNVGGNPPGDAPKAINYSLVNFGIQSRVGGKASDFLA